MNKRGEGHRAGPVEHAPGPIMEEEVMGASSKDDRATAASQSNPQAVSGTADIPSAFERRVRFLPAYDKRDPNPAKDFGIGAMRVLFLLVGPKGAVQWMIGTPWEVASSRQARPWRETGKPDGWDLGYHSPVATYEGQEPMGSCDVLPGECFYDGSGLNADLLIENFLNQGDAYIWSALEAYYHCTFNGASWPFDEAGNLTAQAIDARSGETGTGSIGAADESAVATPCAQDPSPQPQAGE